MKFPFGRLMFKDKLSPDSEDEGEPRSQRLSESDLENDRDSRLVVSQANSRPHNQTYSDESGSDNEEPNKRNSVMTKSGIDILRRRDEALELLNGGSGQAFYKKSSSSQTTINLQEGETEAKKIDFSIQENDLDKSCLLSPKNIIDYDLGYISDESLSTFEDSKSLYRVRVFRPDSSFSTISCSLNSKTLEVCALLGKKLFLQDVSQMTLYLRRQNVDRVIAADERPLVILKQMLQKLGYVSQEDLQNLGREDNSYYFQFTFNFTSSISEKKLAIYSFQNIDLRSLNLKKIPDSVIKNASQVQTLDLSSNLMIDLCPKFFLNCFSLRELRLARCEIHKIPDFLSSVSSLTTLDLSSNRIITISASNAEVFRYLSSLRLDNNRLNSLPSQFKELRHLSSLNLSNNRFSILPEVVCHLPKLVLLDVSFNEIRAIPFSIQKLKNLEQFFLISNLITGPLPGEMSQLEKLKELDLRKNKINNFEALHSLPRLESLLCDYNHMSTLSLDFSSLRQLHISKNSVTQVLPLKNNITTLISLNISFSMLISLPENLFDNLTGLEDLVLDNNRLVAIPSSIGKLHNLQNLSCSNNELNAITGEIANLKSLKSLDLHDNNIASLPSEIWELSSLIKFNISSNLLKEFPRPISVGNDSSGTIRTAMSEDQFQPPLTTSLRFLSIGDNRLTDDVFAPISLFTELRVLNLSYNILDDIPPNLLINLINLTELYLSGNQLSTLPGEDIEKLRRLNILKVNGNRLQTLPAELGKLGMLHTLDVSSNALKYNICNFPYDWNWNWNTSLKYLCLSGNKRLQIKHNLSQNAASHLNVPDFTNLLQLRSLGVMDVVLMVETPLETANRRVRVGSTSAGRMRYGIADSMRTSDNSDSLWAWDKEVPQFRNQPNESLFAIFDAHSSHSASGVRVAKFLNDSLEHQLSEELNKSKSCREEDSIPIALRRTFLSLNKELGVALEDMSNTGAAGVVAYIVDTTLYVANVGDTVAVMCRDAGTAHLVSTRHTPWSTDEIVRIRDCKGFISPKGKLNGELDISRGFGHFHLLPLINACPSMEAIPLTENDEFIILATRSLWDYMPYQTAVDVARMEQDNPLVAAQKVRDFAIAYGAEDSVVIIIIGVSDLFVERGEIIALDTESTNRGIPGVIPRTVEDKSVGVATYKRNRWRNEGPGSSQLARLGAKDAEAPTGWVALVFTDIKNSTFLWENLPTAMRFAVKTHNLSMRRWLMSLGGYEVKTEGDAFRAAFPSVTSALLWCLTMQAELLQLDWPQEMLDCPECCEVYDPKNPKQLLFKGVWVRMGIHWGAPVCEPDPVTQRMDYLGHMVKRSDAVCNFADGGQISVSKEVVQELEKLSIQYPPGDENSNASLPRDVRMLRKTGFKLFDMGEVKLKGLETPEHLSLVFPKKLLGRFDHFQSRTAIAKPSVTLKPRVIETNLVRSLGFLSMRLERIAAGNVQSRRSSRLDCFNGFLTFDVKDNASDEEILCLVESLIMRIENVISTLYLSQASHVLQSSGAPRSSLNLYRSHHNTPNKETTKNINKLLGTANDIIKNIVASDVDVTLPHMFNHAISATTDLDPDAKKGSKPALKTQSLTSYNYRFRI